MFLPKRSPENREKNWVDNWSPCYGKLEWENWREPQNVLNKRSKQTSGKNDSMNSKGEKFIFNLLPDVYKFIFNSF
jgi:hypothetical protein